MRVCVCLCAIVLWGFWGEHRQASLKSLVEKTGAGGELHRAHEEALASLSVWERLFVPNTGATRGRRRAVPVTTADNSSNNNNNEDNS